MHDLKIINDKEVYIVESHHHVLLPWSLIRRRLDAPPTLISLDHHTDTIRAFNNYVFHQLAKNEYDIPDNFNDEYPKMSDSLVSQMNFNQDASISSAIDKLRHDEHIDAAIRAGIIQLAAAINLSSGSDEIIKGNIIEVSSSCYLGCPTNRHDAACGAKHAAQVIESEYLDDMLNKVNTLSSRVGISNVENSTYILDIDLDYFHSEKAISPDDATTISRLIKSAQGITIATEPRCVEGLRLEDSGITADYLLGQMLGLIERAML